MSANSQSCQPIPALEICDLRKSFGSRAVLDGISLRVDPTEHLAILGPNGAGKTTLIRMITGILAADSGQIRVFGQDPYRAGRQVRSRLGVVPQGNSLDVDLNVLDNLLTFGRYFGMRPAEVRERSELVLRAVRLESRRDTPVRVLSGGMQRRLLIARALLNRPDLIVLDEPTTGLDPQSRRMTWDLLRAQKNLGRGMLLTSHYLDEVEQLCDRLIIMSEGTVLRDGTVAEVVRDTVGSAVLQVDVRAQHTARRLVELVSGHERLTPQQVAAADVTSQRHGGARIRAYFRRRREAEQAARQLFDEEDWSVEDPTLEDAYVKLTGTEGGQ